MIMSPAFAVHTTVCAVGASAPATFADRWRMPILTAHSAFIRALCAYMCPMFLCERQHIATAHVQQVEKTRVYIFRFLPAVCCYYFPACWKLVDSALVAVASTVPCGISPAYLNGTAELCTACHDLCHEYYASQHLAEIHIIDLLLKPLEHSVLNFVASALHV